MQVHVLGLVWLKVGKVNCFDAVKTKEDQTLLKA